MENNLGNMVSKFKDVARSVARLIYLTPSQKRVLPWFKINGDQTLRLNYDLNESSVVFDLGGYEGQWTSDIYSKYCCVVYCFEPVKEFADALSLRFARNKKIHIFQFGLSNEDKNARMTLAKNSSSTFKILKKNPTEEVVLKKAVSFMQENKINMVDLMKINIEGGEYDLLDHFLDSGFVLNIKNLQIQFHDFVPKAEMRMARIQEGLAKTHRLTYQFPFVWENWELKNH